MPSLEVYGMTGRSSGYLGDLNKNSLTEITGSIVTDIISEAIDRSEYCGVCEYRIICSAAANLASKKKKLPVSMPCGYDPVNGKWE